MSGLCVLGRPLLGGVPGHGGSVVGRQALGLADVLALVTEPDHDVGVLAFCVENRAVAEDNLELDDRWLVSFWHLSCGNRSIQCMLLAQLEGFPDQIASSKLRSLRCYDFGCRHGLSFRRRLRRRRLGLRRGFLGLVLARWHWVVAPSWLCGH
jgi:hypothetical protein